MALGTINIISSLAAKPIGGTHGEHFLVVDNPREIAHLIQDIHNNPEKYEHMKQKSRDFMRELYTWNIFERNLLDMLNSLV